jgi:uncharacterized phage-associated protein
MTIPFRFQFDVETACQAVAHLLRVTPGRRMNYMRLLKLLYIAERECLRDAGRPLTGSTVAAMQRGPVLEDVFALIRNQHPESPEWSKFFRTEGYHLAMIDDPGAGGLSPFISRKLSEVAARHEQDDEWTMVEKSHDLPEWRKNDPGTSSKRIPLADIFEAIGRLGDMEQIVTHARNAAIDSHDLADSRRTIGHRVVSE